MSYQLVRSPKVARQLGDLRRTHHPMHNVIVEAISSLADTPRPPGCRKLVGRPEWRIRVGDFRILYLVDDSHEVVTIIEIGHRREVYRR